MLDATVGPIHCWREIADVGFTLSLHLGVLIDSSQELERLVSSRPPVKGRLEVSCSSYDLVVVIRDPVDTGFIRLLGDLTKVTTVGEMHRQPATTVIIYRLTICQSEKAFDVVITVVVEGRHRIHATTEVEVPWQEKPVKLRHLISSLQDSRDVTEV